MQGFLPIGPRRALVAPAPRRRDRQAEGVGPPIPPCVLQPYPLAQIVQFVQLINLNLIIFVIIVLLIHQQIIYKDN